ncbi:MAG: EthD family reductase [Gammaproteobacteria bacterium HGW-Gammaproteobacteria-6]|nr:MAG: EthD family reductase [Gammaproteobacteria bacterium HGW-Gammaproteobacteria-6]
MIKASVLYPTTPSARFDMAYYLSNHMPMVVAALGTACLKAEVDKGLAGGAPGSVAPFVAVAHLYFATLEDFQKAFAPHAGRFAEDMPNYTEIVPQVLISQVEIVA